MWAFVLSVITFVEFIKSRAKKCKTKSLVFWNMAGKTVMALFFYFFHTFLLPTLPDAFLCLASLFETFRCFKSGFKRIKPSSRWAEQGVIITISNSVCGGGAFDPDPDFKISNEDACQSKLIKRNELANSRQRKGNAPQICTVLFR